MNGEEKQKARGLAGLLFGVQRISAGAHRQEQPGAVQVPPDAAQVAPDAAQVQVLQDEKQVPERHVVLEPDGRVGAVGAESALVEERDVVQVQGVPAAVEE